MRLPSVNNDQNIGRVLPKMNEGFSYETNTTLIDCQESQAYFKDISAENSNFTFPNNRNSPVFENLHVQTSPEPSSPDANCQTGESEVTSLKDWLLVHNELIQQQNEDILEKERQIFLLHQENEMLKERLHCLEKDLSYQLHEEKNIEDVPFAEDMTQDSCEPYEEDSKPVQSVQDSENGVTCSAATIKVEVSDNEGESQADTILESVHEREDFVNDSDSSKQESHTTEVDYTKDSLSEYNFTINNFCEVDSMKNIKMSIRRKRISSSSVLSSSEPPIIEEKKVLRRVSKRRRLGKDTHILSSKDAYYVNPIEELAPPPDLEELTKTTTLEVPRWRIKHYVSCYTMEGTENLDDEVYNKRHLRHEIDERRRKRWDVQRIREQRVIEKLKMRQEKVPNGNKGDHDQETLSTLWPKVEDVKFIEGSDELPVTAFGHPIPQFESSDFALPWLNNPSILRRRSSSKRSTTRRKSSRGRR